MHKDPLDGFPPTMCSWCTSTTCATRDDGHVKATEYQRGAEHTIEVHEVFQHRDFGCHPQINRPLPGLTPVRAAPGPAGAVAPAPRRSEATQSSAAYSGAAGLRSSHSPSPEQNGPMTTASTDTPSIRERLDRLRPAVLEVAQRYGASNLRVFGSVALNQEHQDSDLDLLVDLPANKSLLALVGITQELEQLLGCPVDVAEPDSLHPLIRAEVLQHAVGL